MEIDKTLSPHVTSISGRAVRTIEKNKVGFHYANTPYDEKIQIEKALMSARVLDTQYQWDVTFPGPKSYPHVEALCDPGIEHAEFSDVVDYCKTLQGNLSSHGISTRGVCCCRKSYFDLKTSNHLDVHEKSTIFMLDIDVSTDETTVNVVKSSRLWDRNVESFADAIREHVSLYNRGGGELLSQTVALGSSALYAVLRPFIWQLSIDRVKRGISKIEAGQCVAGEPFTLTDDGIYPNGPGTSLCDGEGIPSGRHCIVSKGYAQMFFYDHFCALLDNRESTSNAVRTSMMAPPKIRPRNLVVHEGDYPLSEFTGTVIEEVVNDKGANLVSGDYVFNVKRAFHVRKGEVSGVVEPFVLKGNVFNLLKSVYDVGILKDNPFPQYKELVTPYVFIQISS